MGAAAMDLGFEPFHTKLTTASGISLREQVKWTDFRDDARRLRIKVEANGVGAKRCNVPRCLDVANSADLDPHVSEPVF